MKSGTASQTAELVCIGRALSHGKTMEARFADSTALTLLSPESRARVESLRAGMMPWTPGERLESNFFLRQSKVTVARTVAIDDAIREARAPQLVILGAGLDGRAWRMPELRDTVVFEVDHPDTQRAKRARVGTLNQTAGEVRFVPVDFERDKLDEALAKAGHDRTRPTLWLWEGVVMYLRLPDIEATLAVIAQIATPKDRLVVLYHSPGLMLYVFGYIVRRLSEPLRSAFTPDVMHRMLAKHGFETLRDEDLHTIGARMSRDVAEGTKIVKRILRLVIAERRP